MADPQSSRARGRGGRRHLGDRVGQTIRFPREVHEALSAEMVDAGYDTFQDYVLELVELARAAGIKPESRRQDELPLAM